MLNQTERILLRLAVPLMKRLGNRPLGTRFERKSQAVLLWQAGEHLV